MFINFLELEFSVENLLFLTEYIQVKNVIKRKFSIEYNEIIINHEKKKKKKRVSNKFESKKIGFDIQFPKIEDKSYDENINSMMMMNDDSNNKKHRKSTISQKHDAGHGYPISLIASKLYKDLDIIAALKLIYKKYIDYYDASFMINISSYNRDNLMFLFDDKYYNKFIKPTIINSNNSNNNSNNNNNNNKIASIIMVGSGITGGNDKNVDTDSEMEDKRNDDANNSINIGKLKARNSFRSKISLVLGRNGRNGKEDRAFIDDEFKKHEKSIQWLLMNTLPEMDAAAIEISKLMNDTFSRFRYAPV